MRPIRLEISAFGPFAGTQVIEFEKLGENPLFLINGPTGSGKTTILDAICFALYGETTGQDRDPRDMRSQHASPATLTEVVFEFQLAGLRYRVARAPEQERPKARGDGTTNQAARATFVEIRPDGTEAIKVERKVTDANEEVVRLTGLSAEQFRQVMVLPQGRFREFLLADSRKREEIFEQLFQTQVYSQIEDRLKSAGADIRRQRSSLQDNREGILQSVDRESVEVLREEITALEPQVAAALKSRQAAEAAFQAAQTALTQAEALAERFQQLANHRSALAELADQAEAFKALEGSIKVNRAALQVEASYQLRLACQTALQESKARVAAARTNLDEVRAVEHGARRAAEEAQGQRETLNALRERQRTLEGLKQRVVAFGNAAANAEKLIAQRVQAETALESANAQCAKVDAESTRAGTALEEARTNVAQRPGKVVELERMQQTIGNIEQRSALTEQILALRAEVTRIETDAGALKRVAEEAGDTGKRIEHAWHMGQARLLAAELADGEPCPVCGSLDHPEPASGDEPVPDETAVKQAREAADSAREGWQGRHEALIEQRLGLKTAEAKLAELSERQADIGKPSLDDLRAQAAECAKQVEELDALDATIPGLQGQAHELASRLEAAQSQLHDCSAALQAAKVEEAEANQTLALASSEVPEEYRAAGALASALEDVAGQLDKLVHALEEIDAAVVAAKDELTRADTEATGAGAEETKRQQALESADQDWQAAAEKAGFSGDAEFLAARRPAEEVEQSESRLQAYRSQADAARGAASALETELKDQTAPDLEKLAEQLAARESARDTAAETYNGLAAKKDRLTQVDKTLKDIEAQIGALDERYRVVGTLGEIANGRNGQNLSLQRFVLSVLLEDVLEQASLRLRRMSKGRYDLCRAQAARGRSASGLELEVLDGYTGGARSVSTLSGGESFMAALALALGLSDVVQGYAGGIHLDALFIDEGFGSLDSESLDLAINTLIDLRQSGRMVGIISHVAELKERIDVRMDVLIGRDGASVELHA
jgi:exonuclease SbcC